MNVDLSELVEMLMNGGKIKVEVIITFIPTEAPLHHTAKCDKCGWTKRYSSKSSADKGLRTHTTRHCKFKEPNLPSWLVAQSANGA